MSVFVLRIPAFNRLGAEMPRLEILPGSTLRDPAQGASLPPLTRFTGDANLGAFLEGTLHNNVQRDVLLGIAPNRFDIDCVLAAYRRWDIDFLKWVSGVCAIALWDASRRLILVVRDRLGIQPVFFAEVSSGDLLVSSTLDALARHHQVPRNINRAAITDSLCGRFPSLDETCYGSVRRIPPGHLLKRLGNQIGLTRYWDPCPPETPVRWVVEEERDHLEFLLDQAIERCIQPQATAILLSGGLDSASVAAIATSQCRKLSGSPPLALSLGFPHPDCNEEPIQRQLADRLRLPLYLAQFSSAVGPRGLLAEALAVTRSWPFPLDNFWYPAYRHLHSEAARRGKRVILTGSGGDEWLTVTPMYAADLMLRKDFRGLWEYIKVADASFRLRRTALVRNLLWTCGVRPIATAMVHRGLSLWSPATLSTLQKWRVSRNMLPWMAPDPRFRSELNHRYVSPTRFYAPGQSFYIADMRRGLDHPLVSLEMEEFDVQGREFGLRMRHPYWDHDLVEFLYRVPPQMINSGGRSKGLIRSWVERDFPNLGFLHQKKVTALTFFGSVVLTEAAALLPAFGKLDALGDLGIIAPEPARNWVQSAIDRRRIRDAGVVWGLLNLETWLRENA